MFPPIEASVLENNPEFAKLYATLTTSILNPDGTTKADPSAKSRAAVQEELFARRVKAAKRHLIASAISSLPEPKRTSSRDPPVPEELLDLLVLLPPLLKDPPSPEDAERLFAHPPLCHLPELLPHLGALVSRELHNSALAIARIASPSTNPSYLHRVIPTLPQIAEDLAASVSLTQPSPPQAAAAAAASAPRKRANTTSSANTLADPTQPSAQAAAPPPSLPATLLTDRHNATADLLLPLLRTYTKTLIALIHALESKHSSPSRSLQLRAAHLSLASRSADLTAQLNLLLLHSNTVYPPEVREASLTYISHLRDARARLESRIRELDIELAEYGVGVEGDEAEAKERTLREMARVYKSMKEEAKDVKGDLERLRGR